MASGLADDTPPAIAALDGHHAAVPATEDEEMESLPFDEEELAVCLKVG